MQLIEQIATDEFQPEQYEDEVRERVMELIQRKIEGRGHHGGARRGAAGADHRPDGSAEGEPEKGGTTARTDQSGGEDEEEEEEERKPAKKAAAKAPKKSQRKKASGE